MKDYFFRLTDLQISFPDEHQESQMLSAGEAGMIADLSKAELADWLARARSLPMGDWRQSHVLAMVELELGMLQYLPNFTENIKSGRVGSSNDLTRMCFLSLASPNPIHSTENIHHCIILCMHNIRLNFRC